MGNGMTQVVDTPTREDAILDLIISDFHKLYSTPIVKSPIGKSDHNCVIWLPKSAKQPNIKIVKQIQPITDSKLRIFGRWIQSQTWTEIYKEEDVQAKANAFYQILDEGIDTVFPTKTVSLHAKDKPWMTDSVKSLIGQRQKAFALGDRATIN